ncbi:hypothetical protein DLM20_24460, partial [Salmonella enterica subsp. enterica serovar Java]|nr:hypothetical protein [Salmonella enterica subsp. enterica serovar Java]
NETLKAVIVELTGGNVRNNHINLRGAFGLFPDDALGGPNEASSGKLISVSFGAESVETDLDETKAIFRERGAVRRFFEREAVGEGDLVLIQRTGPRAFEVSKASKRGFKNYL